MKEIPLTKGFVALVDDEDYERLSQVPWHWSGGYAMTSARTAKFRRLFGHLSTAKNIALMHRVVMTAPPDRDVDHESRNKLDNRKTNLRLATDSQNQANSISPKGTSQFKGVCWDTARRLWCVDVTHQRKHNHQGGYSCEVEAAKVYDRAAYAIFGSFARFNFPDDPQRFDPPREKRQASTPYWGVCVSRRQITAVVHSPTQQYLGTFENAYDAALYRDYYIEKNNLTSRMNF